MHAKRDVTMRTAVLLIACVVFAILLTLDTGALLSWAFSSMVSVVAHWWALLFVPLTVVVVHIARQKRFSAPAQTRASRARSSARHTPQRPQKSTSPRRRRKPITTKGQR